MFQKKNLLTENEIASFCQQIHMVIKAGLPTHYGISILRDEATDDNTKELLTKIYEPMEMGATLYDALSSTGVFPNYMLHMVHIGEETGRLEDVLDSLAVYYEREAEIRDGIKHAITYPLIMSVMMLAVIIVIITNVLPIFMDVYSELGGGITGTAKVLMNISSFLNEYLLAFIIAIVVLGIVAFAISKTPFGKKIIAKNGIARSLAASRFANCMYLALASDLDTDEGLTLAETLVDNSYMVERIKHCKDLIEEGNGLSKALLLSGIFSKIHASIITIGAETGVMDEVMLRISRAYENETDDKLRRFMSILEPTLIIVLSFFIGLILISFLLPLLGIMSSIG